MALILPGKFVFIHIPKTGGNWVRHVLQQSYPEIVLDTATNHGSSWAKYGHNDMKDVAHYGLFRFAFVRHPIGFWRSFWRYRMQHGWHPDHEIDSVAESDDFGTFCDNVVERLPGYASRMYSRFVGEPGHEIDFIGKQERLGKDLLKALRLAGMDPSSANVSLAPVNAGDEYTHVKFSKAHLGALAVAECEGMERFGYR